MYKDANITIQVNDFDRTLEFYSSVLGLRLMYRNRREWAELSGAGLTIGLAPMQPGAEPAGGRLSIGLTVEALESAMETLSKRGVEFSAPVKETPAARLAFFSDPEGTPLYLCQLKTVV